MNCTLFRRPTLTWAKSPNRVYLLQLSLSRDMDSPWPVDRVLYLPLPHSHTEVIPQVGGKRAWGQLSLPCAHVWPRGHRASFDPNKWVICREVDITLSTRVPGASQSSQTPGNTHRALCEVSWNPLSLGLRWIKFFILLFTESSIHSVSCSILFTSQVKHLSFSSVGSSQISIL